MGLKNRNDTPTIRFSLWTLMLSVAFIAIGIVVVREIRDLLNGNYDDIVARMKSVNGIYDVSIAEIDQGFGTTDAEGLSFRISGKPGSLIEIWSPDVDIFDDAAHIGLGCIGDTEISMSYYDANGEFEGGGCADVGRESDLKAVLPFVPRNLNELITRYDELEAYFKKWPLYPETQKLIISPSGTVSYYRTSRSDRAKP